MAGANTKNGVDKDSGVTITIGGQPVTYSEARLLLAMIYNMKFLPEINWDGVAKELSMANAKSAKERFRQVRIKRGLDNLEITKAENSLVAATPASKGSRKRKSLNVFNDDLNDDGSAVSTPTRPRKRAAPAASSATKRAKKVEPEGPPAEEDYDEQAGLEEDEEYNPNGVLTLEDLLPINKAI